MVASPAYALESMVEERTSPASTNQFPPVILNGAVLAAILSATAAGTGGIANPQTVIAQKFTSPVACVCSIHVIQDEEERLLDTQAKIAGIRHYLSLKMTDAAKVLKVGRPTVYSWTERPVAMHSTHRERINSVYEIARSWRALSSEPMGTLVHEPVRNGITMIDLLSADKLDLTAIRDGLRQIKELQGRVGRRLTVAEAAQRAGIQLASRPRRNWRSSGDLQI